VSFCRLCGLGFEFVGSEHLSTCPTRAPSPQPEMPEGWRAEFSPFLGTVCFKRGNSAIALEEIRALLATRGLHVIDAKQKAVLDACEAAEITPCTKILKGRSEWAIVKAELARRKS
jgi:hypothetical protein